MIFSKIAAFAVYAEEAAAEQPKPEGFMGFIQTYGSTILLIVAMIAVFYFLIIRPQKKREKEQQSLRDSIAVGDEVITIGGIVGKVCKVKEDKVTIVSGESKMTFLKTAISTVNKPEDELEQ